MCSLEEAFQTISESRNDDLLGKPGNGADVQASNSQEDSEHQEKKKKREKKRRAPMPPTEEVVEPDRPAHRVKPLPERLSTKESTSISQMLDAAESADFFPHPATDTMNANAYLLEPNWANVFNDSSAPKWIKERMPQRHTEAPLVPSAWVDGGPTLWKKVPEKQYEQVEADANERATDKKLDDLQRKSDKNIDDLQRKFDLMFKKLEDLEHVRNESQHLEIILFVLGGIFILLLLDLLVKQGTQAMVILGNHTSSVGGRYFKSS